MPDVSDSDTRKVFLCYADRLHTHVVILRRIRRLFLHNSVRMTTFAADLETQQMLTTQINISPVNVCHSYRSCVANSFAFWFSCYRYACPGQADDIAMAS